ADATRIPILPTCFFRANRNVARWSEMWLSRGRNAATSGKRCAKEACDVEFASNYGLIRPEESRLRFGLSSAPGEGTYGARCHAHRAGSDRVRGRDASRGVGTRRNAEHARSGRLPRQAERAVGQRQPLVLSRRASERPPLLVPAPGRRGPGCTKGR